MSVLASYLNEKTQFRRRKASCLFVSEPYAGGSNSVVKSRLPEIGCFYDF
jgi:hypothetical protein